MCGIRLVFPFRSPHPCDLFFVVQHGPMIRNGLMRKLASLFSLVYEVTPQESAFNWWTPLIPIHNVKGTCLGITICWISLVLRKVSFFFIDPAFHVLLARPCSAGLVRLAPGWFKARRCPTGSHAAVCPHAWVLHAPGAELGHHAPGMCLCTSMYIHVCDLHII